MSLAVIGGSSFLKSEYFSSQHFQVTDVATKYGDVRVHINKTDGVVFVQRHAADPVKPYSPPHAINKKAIIAALKQLGCAQVLAFGSVGSMHERISLGTLVVPDDFIALEPITFFDTAEGHVVPKFDAALRSKILQVFTQNKISVLDKAVYVQTIGPRFETAAEIRLLGAQSDIVGMTNAHEAVLSLELGLPYATVCMVDNMANGVLQKQLEEKEFHDGVANNLKVMEVVLAKLLAALKPPAGSFSFKDSVLGGRGRGRALGDMEKEAEANANPNKRHKPLVSVDLVVNARWVVPIEPDEAVYEHHSVVVHKGKIVDILPHQQAQDTYLGRETQNLLEHAIMPGFVNMHTHVGMTLLRGYGEENDVIEWLMQDIWPAEGAFVSEGFVKAGTELAITEMLRSGTTCFNDMYFFPHVIAECVQRTGMRAAVGAAALDFPNPYASGIDDYLAKGEKMIEDYAAATDRLTFTVAPHAPYTVSDESMLKCKALAEKHNCRIHIHLHETANEVADSIAQSANSSVRHRSEEKTSPLVNLHRLGLVNDKFIAVHMTCLSEQEIALLAQQKAHVVHAPYSNLKLASGFCPVAALHTAGVNVCIGTDSTASNNNVNMLAETKLVACLSKSVAKNPKAVPAPLALRMATLHGARALGLDHKIGSLVKGKQADMIALKLNCIELMPLFNVFAHIVYSCDRERVTDVWVDGKQLVRDRAITTLDKHAVMKETAKWEGKLAEFILARKQQGK